jgi:glycosyltransferase involved in cell wall biosynthesis
VNEPTVDDRSVAIFLPSLSGGGAQRVVIDLSNALITLGHPVNLILATGNNCYTDALDPSVKLHDLNVKRIRNAVRPLGRWLSHYKPDSLLVVQRHAAIIATVAKWSSGWKGKLFVRETNTYSYPREANRHLMDKLIALIAQRFYREMAGVIAPSRGISDDLRRCGNVHVIPNPVYVPSSNKIFQHPRPFALGVGRLCEQKRFSDLLRAFSLVVKDLNSKPLDLIILGEGEERDSLHRLAIDLNIGARVILPGFDPNPFEYMRAAKVFVLSSAWEGLPNALIQAMACNCPVVATDCKHGPREILVDGEWGNLVQVGDFESMAKAIKLCLKQGRQNYPTNVLDRYNPTTVAQSYSQLLLENR